MAIEYLASINLNRNELQNARLHFTGSVSNAVEGQIYYDTGDNQVKVHTGTTFESLVFEGANDLFTGLSAVTPTANDELLTLDSDGSTEQKTTISALQTYMQNNLTFTTKRTEEEIEDFVGGMLGGTETGITVTYQDSTGDIDFVVSDTTVAGDSGSTGITPGDTLTIAGGSNISTSMSGDTLTITGTNTQLSDEQVQDIVGAMVTGNTESGITVAYQDADGTLDFTVGTLNQDTTGTAQQATTIRVADNENTEEQNNITFVADGATTDGHHGLEMDGDFNYNPSTGTVNATNFNGNLTGTLQTAAQGNVTSLGTLTTLTVDNVIINGTTIGHTSDTDLITLSNGKVTITGDLDIIGSGTSTIVESSTVAIADSMLKLAKDQGSSADAVDFGFYGQYGVGGTAKYAGIFRDQSVTGDPFTFFDSLQAEPGTTVNTSGTGYDLADISAGKITAADGFVGDVTGDVSGSSGSTTGNAATATALATAREIGGVAFDGTASIDLPGVNTAGNQNTSGNAATATNLVASTSTAVQLGTIELGHASDTTIARSASGTVTIEGNTIVTSANRYAADLDTSDSNIAAVEGNAKKITVTHSLGSTDVLINVVHKSSGETHFFDVARTDANNITIETSGDDWPSGSSAYRVLVFKI